MICMYQSSLPFGNGIGTSECFVHVRRPYVYAYNYTAFVDVPDLFESLHNDILFFLTYVSKHSCCNANINTVAIVKCYRHH